MFPISALYAITASRGERWIIIKRGTKVVIFASGVSHVCVSSSGAQVTRLPC